MKIIGCVLPPLTWHISQIIVDVLSLVVNAYVLNQSHGHWFFFYAFNATITMSFKCRENFGVSSNLHGLIVDDSPIALELLLFTCNIRREACGVFQLPTYTLNFVHKCIVIMV